MTGFHLLKTFLATAEDRTRTGSGKKEIDQLLQETIRTVDRRINSATAGAGGIKALRKAVITSLNHTKDLAATLPAPFDLNPAAFSAYHPLVRSMFTSTEDIGALLAENDPLPGFFIDSGYEHCHAAFRVSWRERNVLGMEEVNGTLVRDVRQIIVNFEGHTLKRPNISEDELRIDTSRYLFEYILSIARKKKNAAVKERLDSRKGSDITIAESLIIAIETLQNPKEIIRSHEMSMTLNDQNISLPSARTNARHLNFNQIEVPGHDRFGLMLVRIPRLDWEASRKNRPDMLSAMICALNY